MTSLSQRKGPSPSAASHAGAEEVIMSSATTRPTTLSTAKIVRVVLPRHEPVTKGRAVPSATSARIAKGTTGAA